MRSRRPFVWVLCITGIGVWWGLVGCEKRRESPPEGQVANRILVIKSDRRLCLMDGDKVLKTYRIALGKNPVGRKSCEGDHRTPEGEYMIDWKSEKSRYHRALHISYPNSSDTAVARERGCSPGGDIMIHGLPANLGWLGGMHRLVDWTRGCIAVTNSEIEEIFGRVRPGTPIEIEP
jgi:murein L,D-transpeptidase YafK